MRVDVAIKMMILLFFVLAVSSTHGCGEQKSTHMKLVTPVDVKFDLGVAVALDEDTVLQGDACVTLNFDTWDLVVCQTRLPGEPPINCTFARVHVPLAGLQVQGVVPKVSSPVCEEVFAPFRDKEGGFRLVDPGSEGPI